MNSITNILRPKTQEEIITNICDKHDIPYSKSECDAIMDLFCITKIIKCTSPYPIHNYVDIYSAHVNLDAPVGTQLSLKVFEEKIIIDKPIKDWTIILKEVILMIKDNIIDLTSISKTWGEYKVEPAASYIASNSRIGYANFVLCNKEKRNKLNIRNPTYLKLVENSLIGDDIIIGRKPEKDTEKGLYIFKYKNFYKVSKIGNLNNLFLKI